MKNTGSTSWTKKARIRESDPEDIIPSIENLNSNHEENQDENETIEFCFELKYTKKQYTKTRDDVKRDLVSRFINTYERSAWRMASSKHFDVRQ